MGKAKTFKLDSVATFANVYQNVHFTNPVMLTSDGRELDLKGKWNEVVFRNNHPIILELACGKGDYTVALARKNAGNNYIGVDAKGARIFTGAKTALEEGLTNVAFARMRIENINNFFEPNEVDEIWITFPDPFPRKGDAKRRLSAHGFLERYKKLTKPTAQIHFKTDDLPLFQFTRESMETFGMKLLYYKEDIYASPLDFEELNIQTFYEKNHLAEGRKINYLCAVWQ